MTLPRIQPIIPIVAKQPFDDPEWVFEFKYDGFRALYYIENGRFWFVSRKGNHLSRFDDLCHRLVCELDVGNAVLDGEVIAADETGHPCSMAPTGPALDVAVNQNRRLRTALSPSAAAS